MMTSNMDDPEDLVYCWQCDEPIYKDDKITHLRHGNQHQVLHTECFLKIFKAENVTIETDEHGSYYKIDDPGDDE